jgi:hypothetical protein
MALRQGALSYLKRHLYFIDIVIFQLEFSVFFDLFKYIRNEISLFPSYLA